MIDERPNGANIIRGLDSILGAETFRINHRGLESPLDPHFKIATDGEIGEAGKAAGEAAPSYAATTASARADLLDSVALGIEELGDVLIKRANAETALPIARLTGERARTCNQLRMFASLLREGSWVEARIETADPERKGSAKPDIRRMLVPLGPVAVFGASNFPLAFSVAGGDTASALAAGCPVVVKGHPAHPGTSELVARAVVKAVRECGMPAGTFGFLNGGAAVASRLVLHPAIQAVAFTGSRTAGRALFDLAAGRSRPIPVYAEMGSVNPVFMLDGALKARTEALAAGYAESMTLGVGQFCTNPGIVAGIAGPAFDAFLRGVSAKLAAVAPATMLLDEIHGRFKEGVGRLCADAALEVLFSGAKDGPQASPTFFAVPAERFLDSPALREELFGPSAIAVRCADMDQLLRVASSFEGQLTATVHFEASEQDAAAALIRVATRFAGRVLANGFPTGVEVCSSMQHGGPYPASTDSRSTSVGTAAILRFVRPVSFQALSDALLPPELRNANPLGIWRMVNGEFTKKAW